MTEEKTNKISIYLLKNTVSIDDVLKKKYEKINLEHGSFYYYKSHGNPPSWISSFFNSNLNNVELFNQSSKGVYFTKIAIDSKERIFAVPFGYGHTMIEKLHCVDDFGLKTVLNIVDRKSIRKIGKRTLTSDPKNTHEQLSKIGKISDFGIDIEQDLIEEITGKPKENSYFGENLVTGKVAFAVSAKVDISNIKEFLIECFTHYKKDDYKKYFKFIDQVKAIRDQDEWNNKLIEKIKNESTNNVKLWMAIPEIIEWEEVAGFSFINKKEKIFDDITLENFQSSLTYTQLENIDLDFIKNKKITAFKNSTDDEYKSWSSFQCFYCEITKGERKIILTNGKWYEVAKDFVEEVSNNYSESMRISDGTELLDCQSHDNEHAYNKKLTKSITNAILMDRKNIYYGGGAGQVEFCDVYNSDTKTFIHVKNYYGSSALSHLFAQGRVSGQLFKSDKKFREKVLEKEPTIPIDPDIDPDPSNYKIIFGIISKSDDDLDLPFFSKVNFKNEKNLLNTFGFNDVKLVKVKRG